MIPRPVLGLLRDGGFWYEPRAVPTIPKVIHQTWKTPEVEPPFRRAWQASWREHHPAWTQRFWTDGDLDAFVAAEFPAFLPVYRGYDRTIKRVDAARYLILQRLGGVFVDLDFVCLRPLEPLLDAPSLVIGRQHPGPWEGTPDHLCNAFMAACPGHPFWTGIEADLAAAAGVAEPVSATGPNFLTARATRLLPGLPSGEHPTVPPHGVLYPVSWNYPGLGVLRNLSLSELADRFTTATAITLWTGVWRTDGNG